MYVGVYVCMYVCKYVVMYACMYACMYVCMSICRFVCIYVTWRCVGYSMFLWRVYMHCKRELIDTWRWTSNVNECNFYV